MQPSQQQYLVLNNQPVNPYQANMQQQPQQQQQNKIFLLQNPPYMH
jgi:hypothetical protein